MLIMADQLAYDAIGALDHPVVRTPNLDRLAESGTAFRNAYCNSPVCAPSRASMLTGRLVRNIGVYDNAAEFPAELPTMAHHLRLAGYRTMLTGKMHFVGPDQLHGFEHRLTPDIFPTGFDWAKPRTGEVTRNSGANIQRVRHAGLVEWDSHYEYDESATGEAVRALGTLADEDERPPFFLCVSLTHPHQPFHALAEYDALYDGSDIPLPAVRDKTEEGLSQYERWMRAHLGIGDVVLTDDDVRRARRAYYAMVSYADAKIGAILDELEGHQLRDNTLVIVTSDHGEMLGEHDLWFKRTYHEHSVRVPLVFSLPGVADEGALRDEVVSLVDLLPTLLDLCDVDDRAGVRDQLDGHSLSALLRGGNPSWQNEAVFEYYDSGALKPMLGIRSGNLKYVYVPDTESMLFNLSDDPQERRNVAADASFAEARTDLHKRVTEGWDGPQVEAQLSASLHNRALIHQAMQTGHPTQWSHTLNGIS